MHWREAAVDVAAIATAACAVLVTSAFFLRPSWLPVPGRNGAFEQAETPVSNWQDLLGSGFRIGPKTAGYRACVRDTTSAPAIDRDIARARAIGAGGTPTIIVDGMRYARNPSASDLEAMVRDHVRSRSYR